MTWYLLTRRKKKHKESKTGKETQVADFDEPSTTNQDERSEDAESHGGWWRVESYEQIKNEVAIEFIPGCYAKALSNGSIVLGDPHPPGEPPDEEEIFTAVCAATNQVAFRSGFGRYLNVDTKKRLMGLSEAIGEQELFLPVFQDYKLALSAYNDCFMSAPEADIKQIMVEAERAGPYEMLNVRVNHDPLKYLGKEKDKTTSAEDSGTLYETELGYLKKYQSNKLKNVSLHEDKKHLKKARVEGELHEALLDKRVKSKSDKYCK